jgi:peptide deformylase
MTVRDILLLGNPQLRVECHEVTDFDEVLSIIGDLRGTLTHAQEKYGMGRGIAAPQIGYDKKVVYIQMPERSFSLINPIIIWRSPETFDVWDSCFSMNAAFFVKVRRNKIIKVEYLNEHNEKYVEEFSDDMSELLQHEIDHLHGVLCSDRIISPKDIVMKEEWAKRYRTPGLGM